MNNAACPRCLGTTGNGVLSPLAQDVGQVGEHVCPVCRGRFLPPGVTERIVVDELGVDRGMLRELVGHFSGARLCCAGCGAPMRPLRLRGVAVDLCLSCGGLWLDAGELSRVSGGRYVELAVASLAGSSLAGSSLAGSSLAGSSLAGSSLAGSSLAGSSLAGSSLADASPDVARSGDAGADQSPSSSSSSSPAGRVVLGSGQSVVVFDSIDGAPEAVLRAVFARTDGLTSIDAERIARVPTGVVVEGVAPEGAQGLVRLFVDRGVVVHVLAEATLRLPPPVDVIDLVVDAVDGGAGSSSSIVARYPLGPPLRLSSLALRAVAAARLDMVDDGGPKAVVDVVVAGAHAPRGETRRLRWVVGRVDDASTVLALPALLGLFASMPSVTARSIDSDPTAWPRLHRREFEQLLAWTAWQRLRWWHRGERRADD